MHSDICEDITGNSTNISPKPEAPGSSPGGDTSSATKSLGKPRILFFLDFSKPGGGHYFTHLKGVCFIRRFLLIAVTVQREPNYIPSPHQNLANQLARFFDFQPKKGAIC